MAFYRVSPNFFTASIAALLVCGCGAVFVNEGAPNASLARGMAVPHAQKKVEVSKEASSIASFDDATANINPKIYGGADGTFMAISFDGNTPNKDIIGGPGANGTPKAAHVFGTLVDHGKFTYPAFTLVGKFKASGYYDASAFTGIKFYYKCPADDQALKRRFAIGTAPTLPGSEGGTCSDGCYNHFGADMVMTPDWTPKSYDFADLKRESGWGSPVTPPDLTDHLKEFINVKWDNSANNAAGSYNIDFWVDQIEFY